VKEWPIRRLVCPEIEEPISPREPHAERRRSHRYARRLPGVITARGQEYPITCTDISYGGIGVLAKGAPKVSRDDEVDVRIMLGTKAFRDEFSVVNSRSGPRGTHIHLRQ
jgi:hypothetical protein